MKVDNNKYFILFANCIHVKGFSISVIMDLQRFGYLKIPNLLFDVLNSNQRLLTIREIKNKFDGQYDKGIDKYLKYLTIEEYGFFTTEPNSFPLLNKEFFSPFKIISSVINYSVFSPYKLEIAIKQLSELGCQIIQLRIFDKIDLEILKKDLLLIKNSRIKTFELYLTDNDYNLIELESITQSDNRIILVIHTLSKLELIETKSNKERIYFVLNKLIPYSKEIIDERLFISNIPFYIESLSHNVGLNRKVCIDIDGSIKNFVNHSKTFGNITETPLEEVINLDSFKWYWYICNDMIEKCKDCQFRYMCLSNSEIEYKDSKYYKVDTCNYNPYID